VDEEFHENFVLEKALIANFSRLQYISKFTHTYVHIRARTFCELYRNIAYMTQLR